MTDDTAPLAACPSPTAVTQLLVGARAGEETAAARLCELLYPDLRQMARARLRRQQPLTLLDTTALDDLAQIEPRAKLPTDR